MNSQRTPIYFAALLGLSSQLAVAAPFPDHRVYSNPFDTAANLAGFTIQGNGSVAVAGGQLRATVNNPFGTVDAMLNTSISFSTAYKSTLAHNQGLVTWAFNLANEDNGVNNDFHVVLASTHANPYITTSVPQGYYFVGGGMVGTRMGLWRFDYGIGGGQQVLIDLTSGLDTLPEMGSFKITFNPANSMWSLYGSVGTAYSDPMSVSTLLGTGIDSTYATKPTPYFGMGGRGGGIDYFDNLTVTVAPEPTAATIFAAGGLISLVAARSRRGFQ